MNDEICSYSGMNITIKFSCVSSRLTAISLCRAIVVVSSDFSAVTVWDIEESRQVAEYKGKLSPKEFGNVLVGIASEYNDALLVVENANIGWATIEQIMEREYRNLYYSSSSDQETVQSYMAKYEKDKLTPGFTNSAKVRPLLIAKMMEYVHDYYFHRYQNENDVVFDD